MICYMCDRPFDSNKQSPLVLLCGHTFCRDCLQRSFTAPGEGCQFRCSLCSRLETRDIRDISCNEQLVEALELIKELRQQLQGPCSSSNFSPHSHSVPTTARELVQSVTSLDNLTASANNSTQHSGVQLTPPASVTSANGTTTNVISSSRGPRPPSQPEVTPNSKADFRAPLAKEVTLSSTGATAAAPAESIPSSNASQLAIPNGTVGAPHWTTQLHSSRSAPLLATIAAPVSLPPRPPIPAAAAATAIATTTTGAHSAIYVVLPPTNFPLCAQQNSGLPVRSAVAGLPPSSSSSSGSVSGASPNKLCSPFAVNTTLQLAPPAPLGSQPLEPQTATSPTTTTAAAPYTPGHRSTPVSRSPSSSGLIPDVSSSASFVQRAPDSMHSLVSVSQLKESDVQSLISSGNGTGVIMQHFLQQSGINT